MSFYWNRLASGREDVSARPLVSTRIPNRSARVFRPYFSPSVRFARFPVAPCQRGRVVFRGNKRPRPRSMASSGGGGKTLVKTLSRCSRMTHRRDDWATFQPHPPTTTTARRKRMCRPPPHDRYKANTRVPACPASAIGENNMSV